MYVADGAKQERDKYAEIWTFPEYREYSPGGEHVPRFLDVLKPDKMSTVIDIGCGVGNAGLALREAGMRVTWLDITDAALDPAIARKDFIQSPLWGHWRRPHGWDYGYCCDVMEHIPTEYVMLCVERIVRACRVSWLLIANQPDGFGQVLGEPLHLTVKPFSWWLVRLATLGTVTDARDLCGERSLFVVERT